MFSGRFFRRIGSKAEGTVTLFLFVSLVLVLRCDGGNRPRTNVLLITIDTLRADRIGAYGSQVSTPVADSLARQGTLFENAFSQVPVTLPSHVTILTGLYPGEHGVRHNGKFRLAGEATTIAEVLRGEGYETAAFIGAYVLDEKYGLSQGFDLYDDEISKGPYRGVSMYESRRASEITDRAFRWIERVREPFFAWVHYFDPHTPYEPPEPFLSTYSNPYDGEVAYVDAEIGRLLYALSRKGLAERTLVVLTSDHGESLGEHGELTHAIFLYSATTRVPLIISLPGTVPAGVRDTSTARLVDIVPTILAVLDLTPDVSLNGRTLIGNGPAGSDPLRGYAYAETWAPRLQYGWSELYSLRNDRYLYVDAPRPELYDLTRDPHELVNIFRSDGAEHSPFAAILDSIRRSRPTVVPGKREELDREDREALENLGYLFSPVQGGETGEDPKDMIDHHTKIISAFVLIREGKPGEACDLLLELKQHDENDPVILRGLGLCHQLLGADSVALGYFMRAVALDPMEERAYYAAVKLLAGMGKVDEAILMLEDLASRYPYDPLVQVRRARLFAGIEDHERAGEAYREAIRFDPGDVRLRREFGRFLIRQGSYDDARRVLEEALSIQPDHAGTHALLGVALAKSGDHEAAVEAFRRALDLDPGAKAVWVDLGNTLRRLGREEEAVDAFRAALAIDPSYETAKRALGSR